ncbi:GAF domain-containing protein [Rhodococcus sp. H29-C3]|uniref:GAF domain-containing protein n=1 Tax=Rhodococcus sp. H29-C3 TaxID=3046307 RepID=UPI0024B9DF93|nr:GAF domain-containing protein [Rhodococcus sp. H29-C3]MDJ0359694.1 GAF domain-containing protein [Rhodococcus sp. H29-C3]
MKKSSPNVEREGRDTSSRGWWRAGLGTAVGGLLLAAGPVVVSIAYGSITGQSSSWRAGVWFTVGVIISLTGATLVGWQQHLSNKSANQSAMHLTKYNDELSGLHKAVAHLLNSDSSDRDRQEFFRSVVGTASHLFPLTGVRVCVYELDRFENDNDIDDAVALKYVASGGRHDEPRQAFTMNTKYGRRAIETAQGTQHRCVENADGSTGDINRPQGSTWKSFMQVPLRLDAEAFGLLSIDCRDQVAFTKSHVTIARAAAALIVLGMKEVKRAADDTKPELDQTMARISEIRGSKEDGRSSRSTSTPSGSMVEPGAKDGDSDGVER